jgi:hypothetical protein
MRVGVGGLIVSGLYLFNQGDILAPALPSFRYSILPALIGSTGRDSGLLRLAEISPLNEVAR